jgi:hypothetical protein
MLPGCRSIPVRRSATEAGELVIVIDCADLDRSAGFWTDALGYL